MRAILALLLFAGLARAELPADPFQLRRDVDGYVEAADLEDLSLGLPVAAKSTPGLVGWADVRIDVWFPSVDGYMRTDADSDSVEFQDDLGLDDTEVTVMPQIMISLGGLGLKLDGYFLEFEGMGTVVGEFTFGGITFNVNEDIASRVQINNLRLVMTIPVLKGGPIALYMQGGISYFDLEGEVRTDTLSATETAAVPIPVGGILAQAKIWKLMVEVDLTGLAIAYDGIEGSVLDLKVSAGFVLAKVLAVRGGYRLVKFDGGADDFDLDVTLDGFFIGASFSF